MAMEVVSPRPDRRSPPLQIRPSALSQAAADLIGGATCAVLALHRNGISFQAPGHPEVLFLSPAGRGLLPLHVLVAEEIFERICAEAGESQGLPNLRFHLEGVRRFTVRVFRGPDGLSGERAQTTLRALRDWVCSHPNGLDQPTAEILGPGSRWEAVIQSGGLAQEAAIRALLGRGQGTTPAGDDFLLGALAHAWASEGAGAPLLQSLGALAGTFDRLTTATSATYLRAALRGEFSSHLASLVRALPRAGWDQVLERAQRVARHGATSGVDTLIGFLAAARFASPPP
jgi:hypothetical protein